MAFAFTPTTGLNDVTQFPDEDALIRQHIQTLLQQLATAIDLKANSADFIKGGTDANGWEKNLVTGIIRQWGTTSIGTAGLTVTYPIAFSVAYSSCSLSVDNLGATASANYKNPSLTQIQIYCSITTNVTWQVWGR